MPARKPPQPPPFAPDPATKDVVFEKGLPANPQAEQYVLGAVLLNGDLFPQLAEALTPEDFSLEKHRRIFGRMKDLAERGERIDRVTLVDELNRQGQLESVDGIGYVCSLDEGLPELANLKSYIQIVLEKADLRRVIFTSQRAINLALMEAQTAQEIGAGASQSLGELRSGKPAEDGGKTPERIVTEFRGGISAFLDPSQRKSGLPTGLHKLDEMMGGGIQDGEMVIIAARPACGKSALALNIAQEVCLHPRNPGRVDFFSLEMSASSLITRMMCAQGKVDLHKFRAGFVNKEDRHRLHVALNEIIESPLRIHDENKTLAGLISRMRRAVKEGTRLIVLDYLQLVTTGKRADNRNQELTEICRSLKLLNLEVGTPIMALSQIGRSAERRGGNMEPQLGDMKDTGAIEETGNVVIALHRPELYSKDREDNKGIAHALVLKNRDGPTGKVTLRFIHAWAQFVNAADDQPLKYDDDDAGSPPAAPTPEVAEW